MSLSAVPLQQFASVRQIGFADQNPIAWIAIDQSTHATLDVVNLWQHVGVFVVEVWIALRVKAAQHGLIAKLWIFKQSWYCVKAEPGDTSVEPEAQNLEHRFFYIWVAPIEIGLLFIKLVVIELVNGG